MPSTFCSVLRFDTDVPSELATGFAYLMSPVTVTCRCEVIVSLVLAAMAGLTVEPSLPPRRLLILPVTKSDTPDWMWAGSDLSINTPEYVLVVLPDDTVVVPLA